MILGAVEVLLHLQAVVTGPGVGVKLTLNKTWLGMWFSMSTYPKVAMFLHVASQSRYTSGEISLLAGDDRWHSASSSWFWVGGLVVPSSG